MGWWVQHVGARTLCWVAGDTHPCLTGDTKSWDSMFSSGSEDVGPLELIRAGSPGPTVVTLSPNLVELSKSSDWPYYPDTCPCPWNRAPLPSTQGVPASERLTHLRSSALYCLPWVSLPAQGPKYLAQACSNCFSLWWMNRSFRFPGSHSIKNVSFKSQNTLFVFLWQWWLVVM